TEALEPGPPPSPRAETQPPKPSQNARWIPGYWRWSGRAWVWLGGMWDVPEADVEAGLTTRAPRLPPPPRNEAHPTRQARGLIWIAGYWQWSGSAWVWATGRWQAQPQGAGGYRAPRWQARGSGAIFIPGGFTLRAR
ncbi:MAG: BcpO-related WXXGXW repeat protein, partial [Deltaproteobacteria bacterium]|nr:BcpO-related WXXGXW repeat protein [Deltaproteobacteria bacterium]